MKQIIIALLLSSASAIRLQTEKIYPIYGNSRLYKKEEPKNEQGGTDANKNPNGNNEPMEGEIVS